MLYKILLLYVLYTLSIGCSDSGDQSKRNPALQEDDATDNGTSSGSQNAALRSAKLSWSETLSLEEGFKWYSIKFVDDKTGYVVGGSDWDDSRKVIKSKLAKTTDGGKTWTVHEFTETNGWLRGLDCVSANECVIAGRYGVVLHTVDGGETFEKMPLANPEYGGWLYSVGMSKSGIHIGTTHNVPFFFFSSDFKSFNGVEDPLVNNPAAGSPGAGYSHEYVKWALTCPSGSACYATTQFRHIYKSLGNGHLDYFNVIKIDGARSKGFLLGIDCLDDNICWVAGGEGTSADPSHLIRTEIHATTDGFKNYTSPINSTTEGGILKGIDMLDTTFGYAVGEAGLIFKTEDGVTWEKIENSMKEDYEGVAVHSDFSVVLVGRNGKLWLGTPTP